jgi:endonuclease-3 related protein
MTRAVLMGALSAKRLLAIYKALKDHNGPRGWWPGNTRLEIIVGAILTQNTAWVNVESALRNLKSKKWLNVRSLRSVSEAQLALAIHPSGYYRQKAKKLKAFVRFLDESYRGSLRRVASAPTETLRSQLLGVWGIGPETADSILLYAFHRPIFVVDAYTHRVSRRHGLATANAGYEDLRSLFEGKLPRDVALWNDYHAQLVWVGKNHCRSAPKCENCPLRPFLPAGGPVPEPAA